MAAHCHPELSSRSNAAGLSKEVVCHPTTFIIIDLFLLWVLFIFCSMGGMVGLLYLSNNNVMLGRFVFLEIIFILFFYANSRVPLDSENAMNGCCLIQSLKRAFHRIVVFLSIEGRNDRARWPSSHNWRQNQRVVSCNGMTGITPGAFHMLAISQPPYNLVCGETTLPV